MKPETFPPLVTETRSHVDTRHAAFWMNRKAQTLRDWACVSGKGPIEPMRVNGRLAWPVAEIKRVMGVAV
jgi:hypothetical protein